MASGVPLHSRIVSYFEIQNLSLRDAWVSDILSRPQAGTDEAKLQETVYRQLLVSDFADALGKPQLPPQVGTLAESVLKGMHTLQVNQIVNICEGEAKRLQDCNNSRRTLKLELNDGFQTVFAFELQRVPGLELVSYGIKVMLKDVEIKRGVLLLTANNCKMVGGTLETAQSKLEDARQHLSEMQTRDGKRRRTQNKMQGDTDSGDRHARQRQMQPQAQQQQQQQQQQVQVQQQQQQQQQQVQAQQQRAQQQVQRQREQQRERAQQQRELWAQRQRQQTRQHQQPEGHHDVSVTATMSPNQAVEARNKPLRADAIDLTSPVAQPTAAVNQFGDDADLMQRYVNIRSVLHHIRS
jgi:hypothetical protein